MHMPFRQLATLAIIPLLIGSASAHAATRAKDVITNHHVTQAPAAEKPTTLHFAKAYARPSYGQTKVGAGFISIHNASAQDDVLIKASTPFAEAVELHNNVSEGDIMRMQKVASIEIPANSTVDLAPGGLHLMFFRMQEPLQAGMEFPLTLTFANAGAQEVILTVR